MNFFTVDEVIEASKEILGEDGVYWMYAMKPLQDASAFRTWCRGIGLDVNSYDKVAKDLDSYRFSPQWQQIIEDSEQFVGVVDSISPSPCSVLLLDKPISRELGLIKVGPVMCCCIDGKNSDKFKYVKNDYLRVAVWGLISKTYELLGEPIDNISSLMKKVDDEVWNLLGNGITTTINQCDSDYDKSILKVYKPRNLKELSLFVAAIRPGFKSLLDNFMKRKPYTTGVAELDELLEDSDHYMAYQESIMGYLTWLGIPEKDTYTIIKLIAKKKFSEKELNDLEKQLEQSWIDKMGDKTGFRETWQVVQDAAHYSFNACVSGDTRIQRHSMSQDDILTVEEMYMVKNDLYYAVANDHKSLHYSYCKKGYGYALSMFDNGGIRRNRIIDIRESGVREIYRIQTKTGAYLDCTMNHRFPTPEGKKMLDELKIGDRLYVRNGRYKTGGIPTVLDEVVSISFLRTDRTYDIEMEHPAHTFVSESGLVTSNSHSLSVGIDALYGAYLKAKHPLQYMTVALSMYAGDEKRTNNLTDELRYFGIKLNSARFGHSQADYACDPETNTIYKGIASIKYLNEKVSEELYELKDNHYEDWFEFLYVLKGLSINSRQLDILTKIDFFEAFGNPNELMAMTQLYRAIGNRKTMPVAKLRECGLSHIEVLSAMPEAKLTEKQLSKYDPAELLRLIWAKMEHPTTGASEYIRYEIECLGYSSRTDPNYDPKTFFVAGIEGKKKKVLRLYKYRDGTTLELNAWTSNLNDGQREIEVGDMISIPKYRMQAKNKPTEEYSSTGKQLWKKDPTDLEPWLTVWRFV